MGVFGILLFSSMATYIFPNPSTMPYVLELVPQCAFARVFYLMIATCSDSSCFGSIGSLTKEMVICIALLYIMGTIFFLAGLLLSEPIIQVFFKKYFSKDSVPEYAQRFMEESSDQEGRHESADEYSAKAI